MQEALIESGGLQCGYCTPGMVLAAHSLLTATPREETAHDKAACTAGPPDRETIREGLSNNLCRCTGYERIARAVELAASRLSSEDPQGPPDA